MSLKYNTNMKGKKSIKQSGHEKKKLEANDAENVINNDSQNVNSHNPTQSDLTIRDIYRVLDLYFYKEFYMYKHLYDSFDKFLDEDIRRFLLDGNHIFSDTIQSDIIYRNKFKFENIRYQSPVCDNKVDPIFPSDARYKSLTYSVVLIADVTQYMEKKQIISRDAPIIAHIGETVKDVQIGYIPLMLRSKYCNLTLHKGSESKECNYDPGGYFIVNGSEKVVISQDRMVENKPLVFLKKDSSSQSYVVQVNSRAYDTQSQPQSLTIKLKKGNIMTVRVPILSEVNVFALFRALGVQSDKDIINCTTYDESDKYMINIVRDSLNDCKNEKGIKITTKEEAYDFLINKIKVIQKVSNTDAETRLEQKKLHLTDLLKNSFLPHITGNLKYKAMYLGYMINRLIRVSLGRLPIDDRDSYLNKRIDLPGDLMFELFRQQWKKMMNECNKLFNNRTDDQNKPYNIIHHIKPNTIEQGLKAALSTGSWIRRKGVAQMLQRLTYLQGISFLRRVDAPSGDASSTKLTGPRQLHPSSIGFLCAIQTPEHAKIGQVKHLNLISSITIMDKATYDAVRNYVTDIGDMMGIDEVDSNRLKYMYKVFLNGDWLGIIQGIPDEGKSHSPENIPVIRVYNDLIEKKKIGYFNPEMVSIVIDHDEFEMRIYCDTGRMYRPIMKVGVNNEILLRKHHIEEISLNKTHTNKITDWAEFVTKYTDLIEYIDMEEQPYLMIADKVSTVNKMQQRMMDSIKYKFNESSETEIINRYNENYFNRYTHCEFHPSILFGEITVNIPFIDSNPSTRNIFQYSQGRQAMGIYATNYRDRLDMSYILYHPQKPIVTTRASKYVFTEALPFGENAIVAVASYTGYNQEDSLIFNLRSLQRGMFRSTSLRKYSSSISKNQNTSQDDVFTKPDPDKVVGIRHGSYDKLNMQGYAPEETVVHNGDILLAKLKPIQQDNKSNSEKVFKDDSESYKYHAPGTVFKVYVKILNADSYETRRMLVRSERTPTIGDKFCSRHGQKGTCGILLKGSDMCHTRRGLTPDIIMNPNAIPSRMTIGQLIECLIGKVATLRREDADGTPFEDRNLDEVKKQLEELGYRHDCTEYMYNGMTGEMMNVPIFIGPTYYNRLKHMVQDKVHGRARGPRTLLTRQAPEGRSRDGGLRVGEMERDAIAAHGLARFLKEKLMDNSDIYATYVCGKCGLFAQRANRRNNKKFPQSTDIYFCQQCNNYNDIYKVVIPYAFKLMLQELMSMCIAPRIRVSKPTFNYED